jgi:hypothetical protein
MTVSDDWEADTDFTKPNEDVFDKYYIRNDYKPEFRTDPRVIQVVEHLGEESWGEHAKLRVVEIPDGISWEIDEYDGIESILEVHRSWG